MKKTAAAKCKGILNGWLQISKSIFEYLQFLNLFEKEQSQPKNFDDPQKNLTCVGEKFA